MSKKSNIKNLFKKLKKTNKIYRISFYILFILYLVSIILFSYSLILLGNIETLFRTILIIFLYLNLILFLFIGLVLLILKKHVFLTILLVSITIFTGVNSFGYYYINKTYKIVDNISKDKIIYTSNLISLNKDIVIKTIGLINN